MKFLASNGLIHESSHRCSVLIDHLVLYLREGYKLLPPDIRVQNDTSNCDLVFGVDCFHWKPSHSIEKEKFVLAAL